MTHFFSYEGIMHLRQNQSSKLIFNNIDIIKIEYKNKEKSFLKTKANSSFTLDKIKFKILQNYENADFVYEKSENGDEILELYSLSENKNIILKNEAIKNFIPSKSYDLNLNEIALQNLKPNFIYEVDGEKYLLKNYFKNAKEVLQNQASIKPNKALKIELSFEDEKEEFYIFLDEFKQIKIKNEELTFYYGIDFYSLPFEVKLQEFIIENYPASLMPKDYISYLQIEGKNYKISMNNFLDYKGFRIFQSSFDENGTILSFNKDFGKYPTYFGYFLLILSLLTNLFYKKSRFYKLFTSFKSYQFLFIFLFVFSNNLYAKENDFKEHLNKLSFLIVQGNDGRLKSFDSSSREYLNKIYGKDKFKNKSAKEVILLMMISDFKDEELIKIKDFKIKNLLKKDKKYYSFNDFFDENKSYILQDSYEKAFNKSLDKQSSFDKEILKIDEKIELLQDIFLAQNLRIFPNENGLFLPPILALNLLNEDDKKEVELLSQNYFSFLLQKDYLKANQTLKQIQSYQKSKALLPSKAKIWLELLYNKLKLSSFLAKFFFINGLLLFGILLFALLKEQKITLEKFINFQKKLYYLILIIFAFNLLARWIISSHAPWSDSYESLVFIAFVTICAGAIFADAFALSLCSLLASIMLFVAHLGFIDSQITSLVPVLNSHYLIIHVFVIISSYGFLSLSFMLAMLNLLLFSFLKEDKILLEKIINLTKLSELCAHLGFTFLIIGNLLGAIWANESWGRYWSWDVKESWTLITILIYAILLHLRLLKKFSNIFTFNAFCALAYFCVLMTYFGVNFYFNGLHSYASGEIKVAFYLLILFFATLILIILAFLKIKKLKLQDQIFA